MSLRCGRTTRSGNPCKALISGKYDVACSKHLTEHERELAQVAHAAWSEGYDAGKKSSIGLAECRTEWFERRIRDLEAQLDATLRYHSVGGDQVVEVEGYAYRWRGTPRLAIGDRVVIPGNWLFPNAREGAVTDLGTTYKGELSFVVRRADSLVMV